GETCDDCNAVSGDGCSSTCRLEGCADGTRQGFTEYATFPNVAVCGAAVTYATAEANATTVCQAGWHMCGLYFDTDVTGLAGKPAPAGSFVAWLAYNDSACNIQQIFATTNCSGTVAAAAYFQASAGCTASGTCSEGWRPVIGPTLWSHSLRGGGV